jgi:hypothetical protein
MYRSTFFLTSALVGGEWSASRRCRFTPGKEPRYPFYRRLGGPQSRSGRYEEVKIFYPIRTRTPAPPGRPARSQSLYRLRYPGVRYIYLIHENNGWGEDIKLIILFWRVVTMMYNTQNTVVSFYFVHRPVFYKLENTTFWKLDLSPSSGERGDTYSVVSIRKS